MMEKFLLSYTSSFITNSPDNTQTAKTARDNSPLKESPSSCATLISMVGQLHHLDGGVHWVCREVKYGRFLQKDAVFITPKFMKHKNIWKWIMVFFSSESLNIKVVNNSAYLWIFLVSSHQNFHHYKVNFGHFDHSLYLKQNSKLHVFTCISSHHFFKNSHNCFIFSPALP